MLSHFQECKSKAKGRASAVTNEAKLLVQLRTICMFVDELLPLQIFKDVIDPETGNTVKILNENPLSQNGYNPYCLYKFHSKHEEYEKQLIVDLELIANGINTGTTRASYNWTITAMYAAIYNISFDIAQCHLAAAEGGYKLADGTFPKHKASRGMSRVLKFSQKAIDLRDAAIREGIIPKKLVRDKIFPSSKISKPTKSNDSVNNSNNNNNNKENISHLSNINENKSSHANHNSNSRIATTPNMKSSKSSKSSNGSSRTRKRKRRAFVKKPYLHPNREFDEIDSNSDDNEEYRPLKHQILQNIRGSSITVKCLYFFC